MPIVFHHSPEKNIQIGLWYIMEAEDTLLCQVNLTKYDRDLYAKMKNENRRKQWLAYRLLLQNLSGNLELEVKYNQFGKPYINHNQLNFSASHSGSYAAVITGNSQFLGIDIEKISSRLNKVKERFLNKIELAEFNQACNLEKLSILWCSKEALYKVYGEPEVDLKNDIYIHSFDYLCTTSGQIKATLLKPENNKNFTLWYRKFDKYMLVFTYD